MFEESFEAQVDSQAQIDGLQRERDALVANRTVNLPQNIVAYRKQHEKLKQQLKSDLKKSNAFVKKLKTITADGIVQCVRDTETVNLTLFVSEIVNAIVATTYKATDVSSMVKLCVCMHQKYEEFCEPLTAGLKQALITPPAEDDPEAGKRKRIQIRFMVELYQAGLLTEDEYFVRLLRNLLGKGKR
jgi:regulator of nonsense transcripts 2